MPNAVPTIRARRGPASAGPNVRERHTRDKRDKQGRVGRGGVMAARQGARRRAPVAAGVGSRSQARETGHEREEHGGREEQISSQQQQRDRREDRRRSNMKKKSSSSTNTKKRSETKRTRKRRAATAAAAVPIDAARGAHEVEARPVALQRSPRGLSYRVEDVHPPVV